MIDLTPQSVMNSYFPRWKKRYECWFHTLQGQTTIRACIDINQIMRQGSVLNGRYRLEAITVDGAVLSYQGYWFKLTTKRR